MRLVRHNCQCKRNPQSFIYSLAVEISACIINAYRQANLSIRGRIHSVLCLFASGVTALADDEPEFGDFFSEKAFPVVFSDLLFRRFYRLACEFSDLFFQTGLIRIRILMF